MPDFLRSIFENKRLMGRLYVEIVAQLSTWLSALNALWRLGITFEYKLAKTNVMTTDSHLNDIREKIYNLRTAIMYSMSNEICKLPNSIVTAVKVNDEGELLFICERPLHDVAEYEQSFPVSLHFYRKGVFFHLEVSGKATIIDGDYSGYLSDEICAKGKVLLVSMSMNSIEYTEPYGKSERSRFELLIGKGYKWLLRNIALPLPSKPAV